MAPRRVMTPPPAASGRGGGLARAPAIKRCEDQAEFPTESARNEQIRVEALKVASLPAAALASSAYRRPKRPRVAVDSDDESRPSGFASHPLVVERVVSTALANGCSNVDCEARCARCLREAAMRKEPTAGKRGREGNAGPHTGEVPDSNPTACRRSSCIGRTPRAGVGLHVYMRRARRCAEFPTACIRIRRTPRDGLPARTYGNRDHPARVLNQRYSGQPPRGPMRSLDRIEAGFAASMSPNLGPLCANGRMSSASASMSKPLSHSRRGSPAPCSRRLVTTYSKDRHASTRYVRLHSGTACAAVPSRRKPGRRNGALRSTNAMSIPDSAVIARPFAMSRLNARRGPADASVFRHPSDQRSRRPRTIAALNMAGPKHSPSRGPSRRRFQRGTRRAFGAGE